MTLLVNIEGGSAAEQIAGLLASTPEARAVWLVARNTALVVIDLQQDFLSTSGYFARKGYDPSPLRAILPAVDRLISAARKAGVAIIHTRQG